MKNKWNLFYNPFQWIAGWKSFGIGIVIVCVTVVIGHLGNTYFYGLNVKNIHDISLPMAFLLQGIGLCSTVLLMYLVSIIATKNVRFQDILGTVTLARYPFFFAAFAGFLIPATTLDNIINGTKPETWALIQLSIASIIMVLVVILGVALLYHAFKVSTNIKGAKSVFLFILIMILSEAITMLIVLNFFN